MITEIGITAGDIWHVLESRNEALLKDLLQSIDAPRDQILMSLGWLAREGHITLARENDEYRIILTTRVASSESSLS